ncbi:hypothetical protein CAXC1_110003 [Candidatus Xenohaliotis californiensis]|uniref:Uncharacterized protein n=1 Tax=Candidatus Xenohaliotis californiensis TaxID=84677 RepID=A0ABP0ERH9_9RICK|nr:hypothetical protein CAXC1_110003 [Candidatus Xenohaliotis californiensis]
MLIMKTKKYLSKFRFLYKITDRELLNRLLKHIGMSLLSFGGMKGI